MAAGAAGRQGFSVTLWNVVTVSLRQRIVPGHLLGRVNSVYRMLGWGLMPAGALAGGLVARAAGLRAPYLVGGLLCALSVCAALPLLLAAGQGTGDDGRQLRTVTTRARFFTERTVVHPASLPIAQGWTTPLWVARQVRIISNYSSR